MLLYWSSLLSKSDDLTFLYYWHIIKFSFNRQHSASESNPVFCDSIMFFFMFIFTLNATFEFQKSSVLVLFCSVEGP